MRISYLFFICFFSVFFVSGKNYIDSTEYTINYSYSETGFRNFSTKEFNFQSTNPSFIYKTEHTYTAIDFINTGNPIITSLISKGYPNLPIFTYTSVNDSIIDFSYFEYEVNEKVLLKRKYVSSSALPVSKYDFQWPRIQSNSIVLDSNQYELIAEYEVYDSRGNPLQIRQKDGKITSNIYDQDKRVVASVSNANVSDIGYYFIQNPNNNFTPLESNSTFGNWYFPSPPSPNIKRFQKPNLDFNKTYILSAWLRKNNNSTLKIYGGNILDSIERETSNIRETEWRVLYYYINNASEITIDISGEVTDMRIHPMDAHMQTFQYDFFNNVIREGDINQRYVNKEYDRFGREIAVFGHYYKLSDIISTTEYHFVSTVKNNSKTMRRQGVESSFILDPFDRLMQQSNQISPTSYQVVNKYYDQLGREPIKYLPYIVENMDLKNFFNKNQFTQKFYDFHNNSNRNPNMEINPFPFAINKFDETTGQLIEAGSIGNFYQPKSSTIQYSGHTSKYITNRYTEGVSAINFNYWQNNNGNLIPIHNYHTPLLTIEKYTGPNWTSGKAHTNNIYKDWKGNILLDIQYLNNTDSIVTYYLYDQLDRLTHVIPNTIPYTSHALNSDIYNEFIHHYKYDKYGNVIEKKLPGQGPIYFVYNKSGNLVASQDSLQRMNKEWLFNKYDVHDRIIKTIIAHYDGSRTSLQEIYNNADYSWEIKNYGSSEYSSRTYPISGGKDLIVNYYDSYNSNIPTDCPWRTPDEYELDIMIGSLVASKVNVINSNDYHWTTFFSDKSNRLTRVMKSNNQGFSSYSYLKYDKFHNITKKISTRISDIGVFVDTVFYEYDSLHRPTYTWHQISGKQKQMSRQNNYDIAGKITSSKIGGTNSSNYVLNIYNDLDYLGRIKKVNVKNKLEQSVFQIQYKYEDIINSDFRGNITAKEYTIHNGSTSINYNGAYQYDALNRLIYAKNSFGNIIDGNFREYFRYDKLNNITNVGRYASVNNTTVQIDSLVYSYSGMRHIRIDDISNSPNSIKNLGFSEQTQINNEYIYDGNGNVKTDSNKGINLIHYNLLGKPDTIYYANGSIVSYKYDANGTKIEKHLRKDGQSYYTYYIDGIEYSRINSGIKSISNIQGDGMRIIPNGINYIYQYDLVDNLNNTLCTVNQNISDGSAYISQINSFYSFGSKAPYNEGNFISGAKNLYAFNGKEFDDETGFYDYDARIYDPLIGKWITQDPMSESFYGHSPYNYVLNNPINYSDPTGMYPTNNQPSLADLISSNDPIALSSMYAPGSESWYYGQMSMGADYFTNFLSKDLEKYSQPYGNYLYDLKISQWNQLLASVNANHVFLPTVIVKGHASSFTYSRMFDIMKKSYDAYQRGDKYTIDIPAYQQHLYGPNPYAPLVPSKEEWRNIGSTMSYIPGLNILGTSIEILNSESISDVSYAAIGFIPFAKFSKFSKFAAKGVGKGTHLVYEGLDAAGNVKYIGITGRDAAVRFGEHLNSGTARSLLDYRVINGATGLSKTQARIWEQTLINQYGLGNNGKQLLNKVNSIAPKNWWQFGIK